ncbi:MAG: HAMP domain-containing sensor histidine kinase, partial [Rectinemataceae bacterium]|nr:HAMP domain-containing sensor histidine kinase [Rectinemataceae bacterium]
MTILDTVDRVNHSGKPDRRFVILVSLGMAVTIILLWLMIAGEVRSKRTDIEYEAFRISASVQEALRLDSTFRPDNPSIVGYGLYDIEGKAVIRDGTAPLEIDLASNRPNLVMPAREGSKGSLILFRPLGQPNGMGMGLGMGNGMGRGRKGSSSAQPGFLPGSGTPGTPGNTGTPGANGHSGPGAVSPELPAFEPHFMWLEYSRGVLDRQLAWLYGSAAILTLLLAGLYAATLRLFSHTEKLWQKELDNRELIQLGEAARTLVHEIKNPLGIIRIQAATLKRFGNERISDSAMVIDDEVMRLAGLADRIRDFLKSGAGDVVSFEIVPWLESYAARYNADGDGKHRQGVELTMKVGSQSVRIDPARLTQALDNLVANAIDAMEGPEGQLAMDDGEASGCRVSSVPEIHAEKRGSTIDISVLDRGTGIPGPDRKRLFEPFFTT